MKIWRFPSSDQFQPKTRDWSKTVEVATLSMSEISGNKKNNVISLCRRGTVQYRLSKVY
jgi:hypothetical protein